MDLSSQVSVAIIMSGLEVCSRLHHAPFLPDIDWQLTFIMRRGRWLAFFGLNFVGEDVCIGFVSLSSVSESILISAELVESVLA